MWACPPVSAWVTPLYRLKTASDRVAQVLAALAEGLSLAAAVRVFGHRPATITTWLTRASQHSATLLERTFHHLQLPHVQLDEIRTRLRGRAHTLWLWRAIEMLTKIIPVLHHPEGTRRPHPGCCTCNSACPVPEVSPWLHPSLHQRWLESVLLCAHGAFWAMGGDCGATRAEMATRGRADLRTSEEDLSTAQARARDAGDALLSAYGAERSPQAGGAEGATLIYRGSFRPV
jgi:hypothetical protein